MRRRDRTPNPGGIVAARSRILDVSMTLAAGCLAGLVAVPVQADTLYEALAKAYSNNPELQAQRAQLRATDEGVAQALSGWRPTVTTSASTGIARIDTSEAPTNNRQTRYPTSFALNLSQPLYRGGRTAADTSQAENDVLAGRAQLYATEESVLVEAGIAYMDVLRDRAVVGLNRNNESVLQRQLEAAQDRFSVGEVTRTDVSQAEARVSRATADRVDAEGQLESSRATYERIIGELPPEDMEQPGGLGGLPTDKDQAIDLAARENPNVVFAWYRHLSAKDQVRLIEGELYPAVNLNAQLSRDFDSAGTASVVDDGRLVAELRVPLYQAGSVTSRVRAAKQTASQRQLEMERARREAIALAARSWEVRLAAEARIVSLRAEIDANQIALDGVKQEALVGTRTVLDVLDAEQELLDARVNLVRTQRDLAVATFNLLSATGRMTAENLQLQVPYYDFRVHYDKVRNKWWGLEP